MTHTHSCSKCKPSASNQNVTHVICSTDIISVYLYKWEASNTQSLPGYPVPVYAEIAGVSTLETYMKAEIWQRSVRGTPNIRLRKVVFNVYINFNK